MAATSASCALHFPLQVSRTRLFKSSSDCCPPPSGHDGSSSGGEKAAFGRRAVFLGRSGIFVGGHFGFVLRFPPNFVRQLSSKARRNCSNIGVAQIVAASWSNDQPPFESPVSAASLAVVLPEEEKTRSVKRGSDSFPLEHEVPNAYPKSAVSALFGSDQSLAVHSGERYGSRVVTDSIATPLVRTSAYWFRNSDEVIDYKEGRYASYEYGRYGNPTTKSLEEKMSALERAESTLFCHLGCMLAWLCLWH